VSIRISYIGFTTIIDSKLLLQSTSCQLSALLVYPIYEHRGPVFTGRRPGCARLCLRGSRYETIRSKRSSCSSRCERRSIRLALAQNPFEVFAGASRHLVPGPSVQLTAHSFLFRSAPLFEEERNALSDAAISNFSHPPRINMTRPGTGLAADDHPMNALQRQARNRPQQRLDG
jgi:hypothetical protein